MQKSKANLPVLLLRKLGWIFHPVSIFVVAQICWGLLMFVWIRWYVLRRKEITAILERLPLRDTFYAGHFVVLLEGCILMGMILVGMYMIFVSFRKQVRLNKLQDAILSSVTHELKTPLATIKLYSETMLLRALSDAERTTFLKKTLREAERLQKLIDGILISARIEGQPGGAARFVRFDVLDIAIECFEKTKERFGDRRQFVFNTNVDANSGEGFAMSCNPHEMTVLVDNLLDNAVKFTREGGRVEVDFDVTEDHVHLRVRDDGQGIEKDDLRRIFHKFFRAAEKSAGSRVDGSGLGLFVSQTIVKSHQGRIYATSDGPGKGATFHVEFSRQPSPR